MSSEELYPQYYNKTNVNEIVSKLNGYSSVTSVAPSGFGQTHLLRYLEKNKLYRRRYNQLKRMEFVYIDLTELNIEHEYSYQVGTFQIQNNHVEALERLFIARIYEKIHNQPYHHGDHGNLTNGANKTFLFNLVNKLILKYRGKFFYIILDGAEALLEKNTLALGSFLKYLRDSFRGSVEYLFALPDLTWLERTRKNQMGWLGDCLTQQIILMKLVDMDETYVSRAVGLGRIYEELIQSRNQTFKDWFNKMNYLSGGYLEYIRYLRTISPKVLSDKAFLSRELELGSLRLLDCLNSAQINTMKKVSENMEVEQTEDLNILLEHNLIKLENRKLTIFSPILTLYLKKKIGFK